MKLRWRYGVIVGLFMAIFSLYPQFKLIYLRGSEWNGHYAYNDIDEVAYAAYIKALIDGRPRKNDPYTGHDDSVDAPQPESLFSIQFAAPYTVAIPARILGIGAPWAMTISGAIAAFFTGFAIFWLIAMITGDSLYGMADSLIVLAGGALFAGEGAISEILFDGFSYPYFPGFRRYLPAMAMPVFFLLVGLIWKLFVRERVDDSGSIIRSNGAVSRNSWLYVALCVLLFAYIVFSYFYIWTTAAAWLGCFGILLATVRPDGVRKDIRSLLVLAAGCVMAVIPYLYLLSKRSSTIDDVQMLYKTHAPDIYRVPEYISVGVLILIAACIATETLKLKDRGTLFAISLALTPLVVFNQQVVTGQSLQPIHYQVFIANYVAGLAMVVIFALIWRKITGKERLHWRLVISGLAALAMIWGFVECHYTVRVLDDVNIVRDEALPAARRLAELAKDDPARLRANVLYFGIAEADDLPTIAPQPVLWARHQHIFASETWQQNKYRYYQQLYYQGTSPQELSEGMKHGGDIVSIIELFGWGRHSDRLIADYKPLTYGEIDTEVARYAEFTKSFDPRAEGAIRLDYMIVSDEYPEYIENVDKWYERGSREVYGRYILFRLKLR